MNENNLNMIINLAKKNKLFLILLQLSRLKTWVRFYECPNATHWPIAEYKVLFFYLRILLQLHKSLRHEKDTQ